MNKFTKGDIVEIISLSIGNTLFELPDGTLTSEPKGKIYQKNIPYFGIIGDVPKERTFGNGVKTYYPYYTVAADCTNSGNYICNESDLV